MGNDNQMKIENEYMTIEFDEEGKTLVVTNKATGESCVLNLMKRYCWLKNSKKKTEVYFEWGKKAFKK